MSLLTICQTVAGETGQPIPNSIVGNNSNLAKKLLRLANREGKDLAAAHDWSVLRKEATYTASGSTASDTIANIASDDDFARFVDETWWDRTNNRPLKLIGSRDWQLLQSGITAIAGNFTYFMKRGTSLHFEPSLEDGTQIAFDYISDEWCESSVGAGKIAFSADADVGRISERIIELGMIWRFKQSVGRAYQDDKLEYIEELRKAILQDGGRSTIKMGGSHLVLGGNIKEGSFTL